MQAMMKIEGVKGLERMQQNFNATFTEFYQTEGKSLYTGCQATRQSSVMQCCKLQIAMLPCLPIKQVLLSRVEQKNS